MFDFSFSADQYADQQRNFDPLPAGWYKAQITNAEFKPTKAGDGLILALICQVIDGPHANRSFFVNLNVRNPNQQAQEIALGHLGAICLSIGVRGLSNANEIVQLLNKPMDVRLKIDPPQGQYEAKNAATAFRAAKGTTTGSPAVTQPVAPAPAAPAPVTTQPVALVDVIRKPVTSTPVVTTQPETAFQKPAAAQQWSQPETAAPAIPAPAVQPQSTPAQAVPTQTAAEEMEARIRAEVQARIEAEMQAANKPAPSTGPSPASGMPDWATQTVDKNDGGSNQGSPF